MTDKPLLNLRKLKPFPVELGVLRLAHRSMADTSSDNFIWRGYLLRRKHKVIKKLRLVCVDAFLRWGFAVSFVIIERSGGENPAGTKSDYNPNGRKLSLSDKALALQFDVFSYVSRFNFFYFTIL